MSATLAHRLDGPASSPDDAPPIILGPSIGTSIQLWEGQLAALTARFRVLRFDLPGHGGAPAATGALSMAALASDVLDLADAYGFDTFHYAGVSIGGAIGLTLAVEHSERVRTLTTICSSARFGEPQQWRDRAALVRESGVGDLLEPSSKRWFAQPIGDLGTRLLEDLRTVDATSYAWLCEALAAYDVRDRLARITAPTLVVCGRDDPASPPAHAREIADGIGEASLVEIARAGHLALVDKPEAVTRALIGHLAAG